AKQLRDLSVKAGYIDIDLSHKNAFQGLLDKAWYFLDSADVLINNAAFSAPDGFQHLTTDLLDAHYYVNVRTVIMLSVGFARRFTKSDGGRIINLTSGQDLGPMPGELSYAMSKGAITAFTRSFAAEVGRKGITVNAVDPGPTDTGWMSSGIKQRLAEKNALGRVGKPTNAAQTVVFLSSRAADGITGQVIHSRGIEIPNS
ncbi:MAG: SDR family oxidoreductase, partial [Verrucomicrobia bacterium]|nr:SDR family oxidoreductase [Verrucomicrobiota bacterium]